MNLLKLLKMWEMVLDQLDKLLKWFKTYYKIRFYKNQKSVNQKCNWYDNKEP